MRVYLPPLIIGVVLLTLSVPAWRNRVRMAHFFQNAQKVVYGESLARQMEKRGGVWVYGVFAVGLGVIGTAVIVASFMDVKW